MSELLWNAAFFAAGVGGGVSCGITGCAWYLTRKAEKAAEMLSLSLAAERLEAAVTRAAEILPIRTGTVLSVPPKNPKMSDLPGDFWNQPTP